MAPRFRPGGHPRLNGHYSVRHEAGSWAVPDTSDTATSLTVVGNLAARLENLGASVSTLMYRDGGHGANEDADDFIQRIAQVTGYGK